MQERKMNITDEYTVTYLNYLWEWIYTNRLYATKAFILGAAYENQCLWEKKFDETNRLEELIKAR